MVPGDGSDVLPRVLPLEPSRHRFKSWSHCLSSNPRLCASISFVCILNKGAPSFLRSMKYESAYEKASTVLGL